MMGCGSVVIARLRRDRSTPLAADSAGRLQPVNGPDA
jgi:hypothetical protein